MLTYNYCTKLYLFLITVKSLKIDIHSCEFNIWLLKKRERENKERTRAREKNREKEEKVKLKNKEDFQNDVLKIFVLNLCQHFQYRKVNFL